MRKFVLFILMIWASTTTATEHEYELALLPTISIVPRDGQTTVSAAGGGLVTAYGLTDWLSVEGQVQFDFLYDMKDREATIYNAMRWAFVPALALHFGGYNVTTVFAGAGYRVERRSNHRTFIAGGLRGYLTGESSDAHLLHEVVLRTGIGVERRIGEHLSVGARFAASTATSDRHAADFTVSLLLGGYSFL